MAPRDAKLQGVGVLDQSGIVAGSRKPQFAGQHELVAAARDESEARMRDKRIGEPPLLWDAVEARIARHLLKLFRGPTVWAAA
jgi:hypothetical protein